MKSISELRDLSVEQLESEILDLRKQQFQQRMKKAAGALDKTHVIRNVRRAIARIKTIKTEKAGQHGDK
jgi:large subunit ribosomal protein L29